MFCELDHALITIKGNLFKHVRINKIVSCIDLEHRNFSLSENLKDL